MYELSVETEFCAAHALRLGTQREPVHGHNWRVTVTVSGDRLDGDGLLVDFHVLQSRIDEVIGPLRNRDLNALPPFDRVNPTAENVARHLFERLSTLIAGSDPPIQVDSIRVTEAPGCAAVYRRGGGRAEPAPGSGR